MLTWQNKPFDSSITIRKNKDKQQIFTFFNVLKLILII